MLTKFRENQEVIEENIELAVNIQNEEEIENVDQVDDNESVTQNNDNDKNINEHQKKDSNIDCKL